jgi:hypothetical protein
LRIRRHEEVIEPLVTKLGGDCPLFLGLDWFKQHNPEINQRTRDIVFSNCPRTCYIKNVTIEEEPKDDCPELQEEDEEDNNEDETPDYVRMHPNVFTGNLTILLAEHREFDHEIKTTDDIPVSYKPYPLTKEEREYLHKWIDDKA